MGRGRCDWLRLSGCVRSELRFLTWVVVTESRLMKETFWRHVCVALVPKRGRPTDHFLAVNVQI